MRLTPGCRVAILAISVRLGPDFLQVGTARRDAIRARVCPLFQRERNCNPRDGKDIRGVLPEDPAAQ